MGGVGEKVKKREGRRLRPDLVEESGLGRREWRAGVPRKEKEIVKSAST